MGHVGEEHDAGRVNRVLGEIERAHEALRLDVVVEASPVKRVGNVSTLAKMYLFSLNSTLLVYIEKPFDRLKNRTNFWS